MEWDFSNERFRCEIQSPSGTGRRTDLEGGCTRLFWPVEEVRGGIALGERRFSLLWRGGEEGMVEGPPWERLRWNIVMRCYIL